MWEKLIFQQLMWIINNRFMTLEHQRLVASSLLVNATAMQLSIVKSQTKKRSLETTSNSFKHIRPGWWFAFIWRVTCHVWSWCTSITLRTLVHSSMQRPAKSSAIRWGSRETFQPNAITSSTRKSHLQNKQNIFYVYHIMRGVIGAHNQTGRNNCIHL